MRPAPTTILVPTLSTIRGANRALSTYSDELILAWSLQEADERKLASGSIGKDERADAALDLARGRLAELSLADAAFGALYDLEAAVGGPLADASKEAAK